MRSSPSKINSQNMIDRLAAVVCEHPDWTIAEYAKAIKVSVRTVERWQSTTGFHARVKVIREKAVSKSTLTLQRRREILAGIALDPDANENARVKAVHEDHLLSGDGDNDDGNEVAKALSRLIGVCETYTRMLPSQYKHLIQPDEISERDTDGKKRKSRG